MNEHPSISVVIPTYNRAEHLEACLASVQQQSLMPYELIVVDDGSTDQTEALCRKIGGKLRYLPQENRGVSAARNYGIRESQGDWIAFLDSDDRWAPTKLAAQWNYVQQHPDVRILQTEELW